VIPPAIFFYYSTLFDSRFKTLQQNQKYQVFLIVGTVEDAYEITQHVPEIKEVNLGNLKKNENRKMITSSVYLNEQELDLVKKMTENGITVQCQAVPTDKKINPLHD
ncbi:PTS sugar transporter subunit IIB, partial [Enterococcus faecium]|nr:PTS sugar transporter subunit IIB [Enterococcus faecium]